MYKLSIILTIAVVALGSALSLSADYGIKKNADCKRLESNQYALTDQIETFRIRDSLNGASIRSLTLREDEFKSHFASLNALVRELGIKVKHIENISENSTKSEYRIDTEVRQSVISDRSVQTIDYRDPYLSLSGAISEGRFRGNIECRDTLTQIVHRIPRKFLFIRWGTKELRQQIVSSNPHTQITYSRNIRITK